MTAKLQGSVPSWPPSGFGWRPAGSDGFRPAAFGVPALGGAAPERPGSSPGASAGGLALDSWEGLRVGLGWFRVV